MEPVLAVFAGYALRGDHVEAGPKLEPYVEEALDMGVSGYVLKHSAVEELVMAIQAVQRGQTYITRLLTPSVRKVRQLRGEPMAGARLTSREREVLQLVAEGRSVKETATDLHVSVKTVQFHKANLARKLGLHTTAELTKYAVRRGMTVP
jgi:DNA-binding NarL/FixJ family response regulator